MPSRIVRPAVFAAIVMCRIVAGEVAFAHPSGSGDDLQRVAPPPPLPVSQNAPGKEAPQEAPANPPRRTSRSESPPPAPLRAPRRDPSPAANDDVFLEPGPIAGSAPRLLEPVGSIPGWKKMRQHVLELEGQLVERGQEGVWRGRREEEARGQMPSALVGVNIYELKGVVMMDTWGDHNLLEPRLLTLENDRHLTSGDPIAWDAESGIGCALAALGHYHEARDHLHRSFKQRLDVFGPDHPLTIHAGESLARLYEAAGRPEIAKRYRRSVSKATPRR